MDLRAAHRYAQALMDLAEETKSLDRLAVDMASIEETIHSSKPLRAMLASPIVRGEQQIAVLNEIFGKQVGAELMSFMRLLVKKGRAGLLLGTAEEFRKMLDVRRNITSATITSATPLSEDQSMIIQAKLENMTGKRIRAMFTTDPALRGGFIARIGDTLIDASLKHQLELLHEQFKTGGAPILN
jgi:F-type H+-transporting ATPase subunit delta